MKKNLKLFFTVLPLYLYLSSNINLLDTAKLNKALGNVKNELEFLKQNEPFYDQWYAEWPFEEVSREEVNSNLQSVYNVLLEKKVKDAEVELLLGDIAHFLYNLNEQNFSQIAIGHYKKAIQLSPKDYRGFWFLAYHYVQSNAQEESIDFFIKAKKLLPKNTPAEFWIDYAFAAMVANMPTTCLYTMDKAKAILKKESDFAIKFRESVKNRIVPIHSNDSCSKEILWNSSKNGDLYSFISRPLGLRFSIDGNWGIEFYDYKNYTTAIIITPPAALNKNGEKIDYNISLVIKVANRDDSLKDFINKMSINIESFINKESLTIPLKYPNQICFQYKNSNLYKEMGGARSVLFALERSYPQYPGLLLENISTFPKSNDGGKARYYRAEKYNDRFKEDIYYILMLDTCEDIYEESYKVFIEFFNNNLIIE